MVELGKYNDLVVVKALDFGVYLDGGMAGEILLPIRYVPNVTAIGDTLKVFIYRDSEDRLIATTETPLATVGEVARMRCKQLTNIGAFMDWGLMKDLLVPYSEQDLKAEEGRFYLTYVYLDETTERIVGSFKLRKHLSKDEAPPYNIGDEVDVLIGGPSDLGTTVVVENKFWGMIYHNETFRKLYHGDRLKGYVKAIRPDNKIDISLQPLGFDNANSVAVERVMRALDRGHGFLPLTDKTDAELIYQAVQLSKKAFKKAIGSLYKERKITIEEGGIRVVEPTSNRDIEV
ncbi:S1-like domain-containing RNA-binding protein [soil metagenome]